MKIVFVHKWLLFVVLFLVSNLIFVSAIGIIEEDIGDYEYHKVALPPGVEKQDIIESKYQLKGTDKIFYVRILPFDDNNDLTNYFNNRKSKINTKEYNEGTTYVEDNGQNLFWIYKNNIIFISSELSNPHDFPYQLIVKYLKQFPSQSIQEEIQPNMYKFEEPHDIFQRVNRYGTLLLRCPKEVSFSKIKEKIDTIQSAIKRDIMNNEINNMVNDCKEKDSFTIKGRPISAKINGCVESLDNLLEVNLNSEDEYSKEDLLKECEIRDYFNERFNSRTIEDYNQSFFNTLFNERDNEFIKKIAYENQERYANIEEYKSFPVIEKADEGSVIEISTNNEYPSSNKEIKSPRANKSILQLNSQGSVDSAINSKAKYVSTEEIVLSPLNKTAHPVIKQENNLKLKLIRLFKKIFWG